MEPSLAIYPPVSLLKNKKRLSAIPPVPVYVVSPEIYSGDYPRYYQGITINVFVSCHLISLALRAPSPQNVFRCGLFASSSSHASG
jgi:hypothetical protein